MDQTIFCFNGFHSTEYFMFIDSATDDVSEEIGKLIRAAGQEDASGSRRWFAAMLEAGDSKQFCDRLKVGVKVFHELRTKLFLEDAT